MREPGNGLIHGLWSRVRFHDALLAILAGYALAFALDFKVGKAILGLAIVGFVPGALFNRLILRSATNLGGVDRLALSVISSLLILTSIGLFLNIIPHGLSPLAVLFAAMVFIGLLFVLNLLVEPMRASHDLSIAESFADLIQRGKAQSHTGKFLVHVATFALAILCIGLLIGIALTVGNGERFTEFYALGPSGEADTAAYGLALDGPSEFLLTISNRTRNNQTYYVEASSVGRQLFRSELVAVDDDQSKSFPVTVQVPDDVAGERLEIRLYLEGQASPVNRLLLQIGS